MLASVAVLSQFPGFARWAYADQSDAHAAHAQAENRPHTYHAQFFSAAQYATVERLTDLIIPADETPGARDAGVAEFIDFMVFTDPQLHEPFRSGLRWLDGAAKTKHGDVFLKLSEAQQIELLQSMASGEGDPQGAAFFQLIRKQTVMGYYTSRVGLQQLDFPGLKLYAHSPACPHKGDPEHKHLTGAGA